MEEMIVAGRISVNGKPAHVGQPVTPADIVRVNGQKVKLRWQQRAPRVILYHKPQGEIVSRDDPKAVRPYSRICPGWARRAGSPSAGWTSTARGCCCLRPRASSPTG